MLNVKKLFTKLLTIESGKFTTTIGDIYYSKCGKVIVLQANGSFSGVNTIDTVTGLPTPSSYVLGKFMYGQTDVATLQYTDRWRFARIGSNTHPCYGMVVFLEA